MSASIGWDVAEGCQPSSALMCSVSPGHMLLTSGPVYPLRRGLFKNSIIPTTYSCLSLFVARSPLPPLFPIRLLSRPLAPWWTCFHVVGLCFLQSQRTSFQGFMGCWWHKQMYPFLRFPWRKDPYLRMKTPIVNWPCLTTATEQLLLIPSLRTIWKWRSFQVLSPMQPPP